MKMNKKADYNEVYMCVLKTTQNYNLSTIPISLDAIITNIKKLKTFRYSHLAEQYNCSVDEIIAYLGSDLGSYVANKKRTKFVIYYNDTLDNEGLDRFTIAHELGHHFLNHSKYLSTDNSFTRGVSDSKYYELEKEANCFSRNLLTPAYLLTSIGISPVDIESVKNVFRISKKAAETRSYLYNCDLNAMTHEGEKIYSTQFYEAIKFSQYLYTCSSCKCEFSIKDAHFCLMCGNKNIQLWGVNENMKYTKIETSEKTGKAVVCPICGNEETHINGEWCQICGTHIVNKCNQNIQEQFEEPLHTPCCDAGEVLPGNARYCPYCGSKTTYFEHGLLEKWQDYNPISSESGSEPKCDYNQEEVDPIDTDDNDLPF